ncbi:hypothetical protein [Rickettsia bellii]|uniref:Uncharacterized protein n=1 Tax=Rickettsia bellii str. RML Mogi TaxID=1359194 RepID=A0A0F3QJV5_RICBE|nr:hypothetical protein [Rickettsia bellii]KJV92885.1 hypothetical protein RBEMOGI_1523 [Rickettsia bellii str. RML Mogi]
MLSRGGIVAWIKKRPRCHPVAYPRDDTLNYKLIRSLFKSPCNKIILIIDKQLLKSYLGLVRSIILGTLSYLKLIKIFICDEKYNADFSDILLGKVNKISGCDSTISFDIKALNLKEFDDPINILEKDK